MKKYIFLLLVVALLCSCTPRLPQIVDIAAKSANDNLEVTGTLVSYDKNKQLVIQANVKQPNVHKIYKSAIAVVQDISKFNPQKVSFVISDGDSVMSFSFDDDLIRKADKIEPEQIPFVCQDFTSR